MWKPFLRIVDPWGESGGFYVRDYRRQLDKVAAVLSFDGPAVYTRFNPERSCAEFYRFDGTIVGRVAVQGECSTPTKAIVTSDNLPEEVKALLVSLIPVRVEFKPAI